MLKALCCTLVVLTYLSHQNCDALAQEGVSAEKSAQLPGGTTHDLGHLETSPYDLGDGPECETGLIVVPEDRQSEQSRKIALRFYRFKARNPSGHAPVFMLPGGPGGFYDDNWVNGLKTEPKGGSNAQAWLYSQDRDVVLVNQRGARLPDRRYQFFAFLTPPEPFDKPYSVEAYSNTMRAGYRRAVEHWSKQGMSIAGYDIMNMVEDINDLRKSLGYEKIALRGSSFGSQWSFSYIRAYPQHVDRAILSGTEPIDYGYDSPQGIWNVFTRLERRLATAIKSQGATMPEVPLTEAIKQIVDRLTGAPIQVEIQSSNKDSNRTISLGVADFHRQLRNGISARRESPESLQNFPKFIYEIWNEDYQYFAWRAAEQRSRPSGGHLQSILIDNSLGISAQRDAALVAQESFKWVGEPNVAYKATRDVNPTPVVSDTFRQMDLDVPILLVHGDLDLSTPLENAEEVLPTLKNAHLIKIIGGTHSAFDQIDRHNSEFRGVVKKFMDADFASPSATVASLEFPEELQLPPLEFAPLGANSLFEQMNAEE